MVWSELYSNDKEPTLKDIEKFIDNELWNEINMFIQKTYNVSPTLSYSCCSAQPRMEYKIQKKW